MISRACYYVCTCISRAVTLAGSRSRQPNVLSGYGRESATVQSVFRSPPSTSVPVLRSLRLTVNDGHFRLQTEKTFAIEEWVARGKRGGVVKGTLAGVVDTIELQ